MIVARLLLRGGRQLSSRVQLSERVVDREVCWNVFDCKLRKLLDR